MESALRVNGGCKMIMEVIEFIGKNGVSGENTFPFLAKNIFFGNKAIIKNKLTSVKSKIK